MGGPVGVSRLAVSQRMRLSAFHPRLVTSWFHPKNPLGGNRKGHGDRGDAYHLTRSREGGRNQSGQPRNFSSANPMESIWRLKALFFFFGGGLLYSLPETNSFAPKKGWLEYILLSYWVSAYFQVLLLLVSERVTFFDFKIVIEHHSHQTISCFQYPWASTTIKIMVDPIPMIRTLR